MVVRTLILCLLLAIAGCAQQPRQTGPQELPAVVATEPEPPPAEIEREPRPPAPEVSKPAPPPVKDPVPQTIAVVLSDRTPAFENVAIELGMQIDDYFLYNLADKSLAPPEVFASISELDASAVIAIGLPATREAIRRSTVPIVFCQVFNIGTAHDTSVPVRGIASTPPLSLQVREWKRLNPDLQAIGAILGDGHDALIAEARQAAAEHGIALQHRTASSDREMLFAFQRMAPAIQGFWLFPDNRVLSVEILRDVLDYAARHDVQIATFNSALLQMGAALSSTTVESDIAATALAVARKLVSGEADEVPYMTPLNEVRTLPGIGKSGKIELASGAGGRER